MDFVSRQPLSEPRVTRQAGALRQRDPLLGHDLKSGTQSLSSSLLRSFHFSMLFSLADGFKEEAIAEAEPTLANNLRNLRDHDIGIFSNATEYVGRGATFSVRRTLFGDSKDVVFKSRVPDPDQDGNTPFMQKIEAILLELRVLTHSPLRKHDNIVRLIQVGWEGDALDKTIKWPVLIIDFADRGTLADFFENEAVVDFSTKRSISLDVAKGLQGLHDCQIVHGDLKLLNVLIYSDDDRHVVAKLSDFGGALLDSPDILAKPMGTPPWTAPEYDTLRSRGELLKSDIYALGLLIWQVMIDGNDPFCDDSIFDLPKTNIDRLDAIKQWKQSDDFLNKAKTSIYNYATDADYDMISKVFESSLQVDQNGRDLDRVISCLQDILEV
jgi:serine/threonine protein kinase